MFQKLETSDLKRMLSSLISVLDETNALKTALIEGGK